VTGSVVDASRGVVPGATVTITNADTGWRRDAVTGGDGRFVFVDVLAGTYIVSAVLEGFKIAERKNVVVASTDRVEVRPLVLEVGGLNQTISVQGDADLVQTSTAARGGSVTGAMLEDIALKGRDALGTIKLIPGVVDVNAREAPSWNLLSGLSINGRNNINLAYDGVSNNCRATPGTSHRRRSIRFAEIRVQSSNFQASTAAALEPQSLSSPAAGRRTSTGAPRSTSAIPR
jgi:hypothetical protein